MQSAKNGNKQFLKVSGHEMDKSSATADGQYARQAYN